MSRLIAAMVSVFLLAAGPAQAFEERDSERVPVLFDLMTRVVFGIPLTIVGTAAMVPAGLLTAITRPTEIDKPFRYLVVAPARYTWVDPLGYHPDPNQDRSPGRRTSAVQPAGPPSGD